MACLPPKAGTTSWQRFFIGLLEDDIEPEQVSNGNQEVYHYLDRVLGSVERYATLPWHFINGETVSGLLSKYEHYTKMINTRHPFARLLSAWHNKFAKKFNSKRYVRQYGAKIAKFKDDNIPETHLYSFKQFIQYVASDKMENYGEFCKDAFIRNKLIIKSIIGSQ